MRVLVLLALVCMLLTGCGQPQANQKILGAWQDTLSNDELYIIRENKDVLICYQEGKELRKVPAVVVNKNGLEYPMGGKKRSLVYADSTDHIRVLAVEFKRIELNTSDSLYPRAKELSAKLVGCLNAARSKGVKSKNELADLPACRPYLEEMHALENNFRKNGDEMLNVQKMKRVYDTQGIIGIMQQIMKKEHTSLYVYGLEIWE